MTIAVYIVDGTTQIVLTPETQFERRLIQEIPEGTKVVVKMGSFYECAGGDFGGWYRQTKDNSSLILRIDALKDVPVSET